MRTDEGVRSRADTRIGRADWLPGERALDDAAVAQHEPRIRHRREHAVGEDAMGTGLKRERQFLNPPRRTLAIGNIAFYRLSDARLDGKGTTE